MIKEQQYEALVKKRKDCRMCEYPYGLKNQSVIANGNYDQSVSIGAWSLWQGSLDAEILLVGQDWGDQQSYEKDLGLSGVDDNVTDMNLIELFSSIGIDLKHPREEIQNPQLFFTNLILCLKQGGLAAKISGKCYDSCAKHFLKDLIEIIEPKIIISLGKNAYQSIVKLYGEKPKLYKKLLDEIKQNNQPLSLQTYEGLPPVILLPAPHCGQYSTNTFMNLADQKMVWSSLKEYI